LNRLHAANLARQTGIAHGFFGREGGVSSGLYASLNCGPGSRDDPSAVAENRRRVAAALHPAARIASLAQIHSPLVHVVGSDWDASARPEGDGMVTAAPGLALGILTADCAPVLFSDSQAGVIGAAHAGWKGALGGVLEATVGAMRTLGATKIAAAIGPSISAAHYEVSSDFRDRFLDDSGENTRFFGTGAPSHYYFNLEGYVAARLDSLDLSSVELMGVCTYPKKNGFFSYRRTTHAGEPDYGREISAILIIPDE
jgi:YfiH family protein